MNRDQVEGTAKDVAGKVQRKVGDATDNMSQQIKGGAKQVEGKVQRKAGDVEEASDKADDDTRE
ncbi:MAG TPA: CsbD family protein [Casimicrobiaceae bacterium]|nr:CsbD family protein [Casimicrobiaceae bacterium]